MLNLGGAGRGDLRSLECGFGGGRGRFDRWRSLDGGR